MAKIDPNRHLDRKSRLRCRCYHPLSVHRIRHHLRQPLPPASVPILAAEAEGRRTQEELWPELWQRCRRCRPRRRTQPAVPPPPHALPNQALPLPTSPPPNNLAPRLCKSFSRCLSSAASASYELQGERVFPLRVSADGPKTGRKHREASIHGLLVGQNRPGTRGYRHSVPLPSGLSILVHCKTISGI